MQLVDAIARAAADQGVRTAFGMPGGDTLPLVDALARAGIDLVLVRDEASAGFAADATAQLTRGMGMAVSTFGPGLTNLSSGISGCLLDRAPVLAITSRYRSDRHVAYTHMMMAQHRIMEATGKAHMTLTPGGVHSELHKAIAIAQAPRPGPVWLEVPTESATAGVAPAPPRRETPEAEVCVTEGMARTIARWRRPAILVGFGGRNARIDLLAEALRAPVFTTYKAKGAIPEGQGWSAGAAGLSTVADAVHRATIDKCDGLLLVGWDPVELRDHWLPGWGPEPSVIVLDDHVPTDLPSRIDALATGGIAGLVRSLTAQVQGPSSAWSLDEVAEHRATWGAIFAEEGLGPATAVRAVQAALPPDAVVSLDVGAHRITASHVFSCARPNTLLQSNGFASMGYGLPAALAAAAIGRPAVCITGDMGLQMTLGELGVAAERGWPVVVVVFSDQALSLIELKQERLKLPSRGMHFNNPDWPALARAFGGDGCIAASTAELRRAVTEGLQRSGPTVISVPVDAAPYRTQM